MNGKKLTPAGIVIVAGGAVILIASFLSFYTLGSVSATAWSSSSGLFPLATLPALLGLIMAAHVAITTFADVSLPAHLLGFDWKQIQLLLGIQSALLMVCFLIVDHSVLSFGIGFWLMLLSAIALAVGAVMLSREPASATPPV
jgi:hypothetical protein